MADIRPIRTEQDYEAALVRIAELMDALSPPEGQIEDAADPRRVELDVLSDLVEQYEDRHYPIDFPGPVAAIEFQMDQMSMTQRDLVPFIGSRAKVSEVLSGKRPITMAMARALHQHLRIPADILLRNPGATLPHDRPDIDWTRFPLKALAKAGWIPDLPRLKDHAEELVRGLIDGAGGPEFALAPLYRKNDDRRVNAKTDEYALNAWCWRVIAEAKGRHFSAEYQSGTVTPEFLRTVAQLSASEEGPRQARDFLAERGIGFEFVPHLPRTHLDGAALRLPDGRPVVAMTLRYDRIDNFWFTLLHELAHVRLHLDGCGDDNGFVDDHNLRGVESGGDSKEQEADLNAQDALIPREAWDDGAILEHPTPMAVLDLVWEAGVHPAIVAGRVRRELGNYRLLSQFVGTGEVRRHFAHHDP